MSELPKGWVETTLGELVVFNPKLTLDDETEIGFVPMSHAPTNFRDKLNYDTRSWGEVRKAYTHFANGDVIFAKVTPCFENGKAAVVRDLPNASGAGSSEFHVLRPVVPDISPTYLLAIIKSAEFLREGEAAMTGAVGLRRVPRSFVESFPVRLPPVAEQARIAQTLDGLLAQVDTLKARLDALPALIKRFRQSVLSAAFSGKLTADTRQTQIAPHSFQTGIETIRLIQCRKLEWAARNIHHNESKRVSKRASGWSEERLISSDLPDDWALSRLEDAVLMIVDCHNKTAPYVQNGIPLIRTPNVRQGSIVWEDMKYVDQPTYEFWSKRCPPQPGDLIFTREAPMGEIATIPFGAKFCLGQRTMLIRPIEALISERYIRYVIMAPEFQASLGAGAVGGGVLHLRVGDVSELALPVPPKHEQTEIVRRVEQLFAFADQLEARLTDARARVDALTQSILAKAFRGELVPQDPADEPASVLLERIKAQRAAAPKPKRGRKPA